MIRKINLGFTSNNDPTDDSWAIITPSYAPDFARCQLLCESIDAFVVGTWHHYIIVSTDDLPLFAPLAGAKRSIIEKQSLLPKGMTHLPRFSKLANLLVRFMTFSLWFSWSTGFMVGWQVQQLVKIEMACRVKETGIICCDSDLFFVRTFLLTDLIREGGYRFFRSQEEYAKADTLNSRFITSSAKLLGLTGKLFPTAQYVDWLVTWHKPTVLAMRERIAKVSRGDWRRALARNYFLSEYSLYGLFVDRVLTDKSKLRPDHIRLCQSIWKKTTMDDAALSKFCDSVSGAQVAIGVQSFAGVSIPRLVAQFQRAVDREIGKTN